MANGEFIHQSDGTFALRGDLTFAHVPGLVSRSSAWLSDGRENITIDMASVTRVDSAGLALMLEWMKQARQAGMQMHFDNIPSHLSDLIRVSGLSDVIA